MKGIMDELKQLLEDKDAISETASFYLHEIERLKAEVTERDALIENLRFWARP